MESSDHRTNGVKPSARRLYAVVGVAIAFGWPFVVSALRPNTS
jgi:hypothetical protein